MKDEMIVIRVSKSAVEFACEEIERSIERGAEDEIFGLTLDVINKALDNPLNIKFD